MESPRTLPRPARVVQLDITDSHNTIDEIAIAMAKAMSRWICALLNAAPLVPAIGGRGTGALILQTLDDSGALIYGSLTYE